MKLIRLLININKFGQARDGAAVADIPEKHSDILAIHIVKKLIQSPTKHRTI